MSKHNCVQFSCILMTLVSNQKYSYLDHLLRQRKCDTYKKKKLQKIIIAKKNVEIRKKLQWNQKNIQIFVGGLNIKYLFFLFDVSMKSDGKRFHLFEYFSSSSSWWSSSS